MPYISDDTTYRYIVISVISLGYFSYRAILCYSLENHLVGDYKIGE